MIIKELRLRNFRNINSCALQFQNGCTVLVGQNAQGKTNVLESLVFLSTTRSHRLQYDQQMIQDGKELCNIECILLDDIEKKIGAVIYSKGKTLLLNQQPVAKSSDFIGKLNVILFAPSDLEIFDDSPKERRRVMDIEIGKCSQSYMFHLTKYCKLLKERNMCLKINRSDDSYMSVLENQMIESQVEICIERKKFFDSCNKTLSDMYAQLSDQVVPLKMIYQSCIPITTKEQMKIECSEMIEKNREKDSLYKMTSSGIHRDDFYFEMYDKKVELFCSQGQKRMVVLALKFSLIEYIKEKQNVIPILLLDDVLSELDSDKRKNLFKLLDKEYQTIITTTELVDGFTELRIHPKIIEVSNGEFKTKEDTQ